MDHILAERTLKVEVDGQPDATLRVMLGLPVRVRDVENKTDIEFHGPEAGAVLKRWTIGGDPWQSVRHAFWICRDLARSVCNTKARITYQGDENWSEEMPPVPESAAARRSRTSSLPWRACSRCSKALPVSAGARRGGRAESEGRKAVMSHFLGTRCDLVTRHLERLAILGELHLVGEWLHSSRPALP